MSTNDPRMRWQCQPAKRFFAGLWSELKARGWHGIEVDPKTGRRCERGKGVWVMRITARETDDAVTYAKRARMNDGEPALIVKSRPL